MLITFKNLPTEHPESLAGLVHIQPGRVVSRGLSRSEHCQMTLLAFGAGESVSEESYPGDTLYYILEGEMPLHMAGRKESLSAGDCIAVPANVPHGIGGDKAFKLLQITLQA